ncbi:MAG: T9SS type A sorting domain-containing protein, partial [Bacteroidales bacterium]|nr:T9SS type A sorting domain-containing protein [Bacteroidales bacterium]
NYNPEIGVTDYGYNPKYYPTLMFCDEREPIQLDFPDTCYYTADFLATCVGCDELMYPECAHPPHYQYPIILSPAGMFPIKAVENEVSEDTVNSALSRVELEKSVTVSPIPTKDVLNISCDNNIIGIEIRDGVGRLLEERKVNERNLQLNVSNYSAGTYVVVVITEKGRIGKKVIVQK